MTIGGYDSHREALIAFAKFYKVESVIEFGAGKGSTPLFLDKNFFPDLKSLVSFEQADKWADEVRNDDPRHTLIVCPHGEFEERSKGMKADLVFLDSAPIDARMALVKPAREIGTVIAIHDIRKGSVGNGNMAGQHFKYAVCFNSHMQTAFGSDVVNLYEMKVHGKRANE